MDTQPQWTENPDPMLLEQFQVAVAATQIRKPELIEACKAVLVDGRVATDVAAKYDIDPANVYRALATIKERWDRICADEEWEYCPLAFPRPIMKVMLEFQREQLSSYKTGQKSGRSARKKKGS